MRLAQILSALLCAQAFAANDSFSDLNFGMTPEQVQKRVICALKFDEVASRKSLKVYSCDGMHSARGKTYSTLSFIEGRLERISIQVGSSMAEAETEREILAKKYGKGTFDPKQRKKFERKLLHFQDDIYKDGKIILRTVRELKGISVFLIHSTQRFDAKVRDMEKEI